MIALILIIVALLAPAVILIVSGIWLVKKALWSSVPGVRHISDHHGIAIHILCDSGGANIPAFYGPGNLKSVTVVGECGWGGRMSR